ncbi:bifunctional adenosylcobinamide kinase/adenosylcobinamide-phosphate guanylyltransferase [Granulosicoccus antarcticus]|uniref:Bifunctional adenosylcobalamin biosynthesis protein n=1 Tax=Granulosicoccus antarcticus IMCC3135 TaxID=1192854 RepID=A0A2Z2NN54_9GAMM|nr:bifunctional adenosylcobinamide kinase/adenosylcobinamide-phosphate guanylyltransferase [Granulosicoccus antarcticus]ASJ71351.1 Bifunctional adenosylcobalamin biosynthesis protein CobP [Granulosicoccus antarcticus IMCC3135]
MKTLILGGVKSGKSRYAEQLASTSETPVTVIATATADDPEMQIRIARHQADRNSHWQVVEEPLALASAISSIGTGQCILVDCLTLWITNLLLHPDTQRLAKEKNALLETLDNCENRLIIVSNETNMGIVPMGELSRRYCDEVGLLHQSLAAQSDEVVLVIAGLSHHLKSATQ